MLSITDKTLRDTMEDSGGWIFNHLGLQENFTDNVLGQAGVGGRVNSRESSCKCPGRK